jgi:hypothetical protein
MSEEFLDGAGNVGADRQLSSAADVAAAWLQASTVIPPQFAVGTAKHETSYTLNERDTEPSGKQTGGIFQLTLGGTSQDLLGDAALQGFPEADVYTLAGSCKVFAAKQERQLAKIQAAVDSYNAANGIAAIDWSSPPTDVWAYLGYAHNVGIGSASSGKGCLATIARYGLNWEAFKQRNAGKVNFATDRDGGVYGDDCISGGADFTSDMAAASSSSPAPLVSARNEARLRVGLLVALLALLLALQWPKLLGKVVS